MAYINPHIAENIGNSIGRVSEVDVLDGGKGRGSFLELRLKLI